MLGLSLLLISLLMLNAQNQLKSLENIKKLRHFESQETAIIYQLKQQLQKELIEELEDIEKEKEIQFILPFEVSYSKDNHTYYVNVLSDYYETIIIELDSSEEWINSYTTIHS